MDTIKIIYNYLQEQIPNAQITDGIQITITTHQPEITIITKIYHDHHDNNILQHYTKSYYNQNVDYIIRLIGSGQIDMREPNSLSELNEMIQQLHKIMAD